ncbi:MAG: TauD/TfdA dioxygenase family protein [Acidimicrobiales bacterium]
MSMQNIWSVQTPAQVAGTSEFRSTVRPVAGSMGAYVTGIDVADMTEDDHVELRALLHRFKAVMLRDQRPELSWPQYLSLGRHLGELAVDPYVEPPMPDFPEIMGLIREADATGYNFGGDWHSDGSYLERPGGLTILWGRDVPPVGGDTLFANLELAWTSLSPAFREMLDGRRCLHAATGLGTRVPIARKGDYSAVNFGADLERIEHLHPIKRTHPETGGFSLFVNQAYSVRIEGCTEDESAAILKFLFDWSVSPAMTARMVWEPNTILIWDNRATVHYAIGDYGGHRREMYRLAVTGEIPV